MIVRLISVETTDGSGRRIQLTLHENYEVLGIEGPYYRLVPEKYDDLRQFGPCLYDQDCFVVADSSEPSFWVTRIEDGDRYSYPKEWATPGFFEDYHDGISEVRTSFWSKLSELYPHTWKVLQENDQLKNFGENL